MSPEQRQVANDIVAGPRGAMAGPFNAWLRSPPLADRMQKVGEYVRFHSSIPHRLNELAILVTARAWSADFEWWAHYQIALKAGLDAKIADAIAAGRRPGGMSEDERAGRGRSDRRDRLLHGGCDDPQRGPGPGASRHQCSAAGPGATLGIPAALNR
jgi:hypothetical protein